MPNSKIIIESLKRSHARNSFDCNDLDLNHFLQKYAMQNQESGFSRTFVAIEEDCKAQILGYYSITAASIDKNNLPEKAKKRFPNHPTPIIRLARLAVDLNHQKKGLGEYLLIDALDRSLKVSSNIGCVAVIVDAKHETAKNFYLKYEFESLPHNPLVMWLPMHSIEKLFK